MSKIIIFILCLTIPLHANAFSLSLGNEALNVDAEYVSDKVNGENNSSRAELSFSYDPSLNNRWSLWMYNTTSYDRMVDISFEDFAGGGIKYYLIKDDDTKLSFSTGILGHYINAQWDMLYSHRLKYSDVNVYGTAFYQHDMGLESDYISKCIVGYRLGKHLSLYHKRERRTSYRRIENGIGVHYEFN